MAGPLLPAPNLREGLVIRACPHYLSGMGMLKDVSVSGGFGDLVAVFRQSEPGERLLPAALAMVCTSVILFLFWLDPQVNTYTYVPQEVIYVENWTNDRTDEEIMQDRWEVQCLKDKLEAERRDAMKELGRMSGMDVEEIEREAEAARKARGEEEVERPAGLQC
jgi:hypothetical protein|tara:strand:- start:240 stop:731 length:492 start_codon:yes stop_codon:yes gene_type:complete